MIVTMRSEDLPVADRFAWWCELAGKDTAPTLNSSPHAADFRTVVTLADLGPANLAMHTYPEMRAVRTPMLIRRSDPERFGLSLVTGHNALWMAQRDRDAQLDVGDLLLHDTSRPYDAQALPGAGSGGMVMLHFPKTALPLRPERLDGLLARRLPARAGMTAIMARYLVSVAAAVREGEVGAPEAERLGSVALDLAAAMLAAQLDAEDRLPPETRRRALLAQIEAFVDHNLGDLDLTPATIAARHHISVGYLHRLFQARERTVAAWIRHRRLARCRADLADPRLRTQPVHAIGARWGFRSPAEFSRAFRAAHGVPPGDYRRQALAAASEVTAAQ